MCVVRPVERLFCSVNAEFGIAVCGSVFSYVTVVRAICDPCL